VRTLFFGDVGGNWRRGFDASRGGRRVVGWLAGIARGFGWSRLRKGLLEGFDQVSMKVFQ
jgi:hypothetical protein